jgi:hypothetical protein
MNEHPCQIHYVPEMAHPLGILEVVSQIPNRFKRATKRRLNFIRRSLSDVPTGRAGSSGSSAVAGGSVQLEAGDLVRVKSKEEILATLNRWNELKGCGFMEEMWPYCNTQQRVLKVVRQFLDERDYRMKKTKGIVVLDGVMCQGTVDFGRCDRSCFFFWRMEWLERI